MNAVDHPKAEAHPGRSEHPLGPVVTRVPCTHAVQGRVVAAFVAAGCIALLSVAAWVTPSPEGLGTHNQLVHLPCTFVYATGLPCPTCGMTTAYAHFVRGQWLSAFKAQPLGLLLALATVVAAVMAVSVVITGKTWLPNWYRINPLHVILTMVGLIAASWAFKITLTLWTRS